MHKKALLLLFLFFLHYKTIEAGGFWSFDWVNKMFSKSTKYKNSTSTTDNIMNIEIVPSNWSGGNGIKRSINPADTSFWENSLIPPHCEEAILLPLARLKVVSPEKIIELVTTSDLEQTCCRVATTVQQVNEAIEKCAGFPPDHLYKKLCDGLSEFNKIICTEVKKDANRGSCTSSSKKRLVDYKECLNQLQDELYDCEGPADWFEKRNTTIACQFYNDIIDCNYVKAAMLCGKNAARLIRDFSDAIMRKVLTFRCKKSRAIPHVDSPMIDRSSELELSVGVLCFSLALIYFLV